MNQTLQLTDYIPRYVSLYYVDYRDYLDEHEELLRFVQHKLFSLGSYLATDLEKTTFPVESHISLENAQRTGTD